MAEEHKRFSDEVELLLRGSGWYPGRQVEDSILEPWYAIKWVNEPGYSMMFPAALRVLREFGGLTFPYFERGRTFPIRPFTIDPLTLDARLDGSWLRLQWDLQEYLYPLGALEEDDDLVITPRGWVYSTTFGLCLHGLNFDQALSHLLLGIQPLRMEELVLAHEAEFGQRVVKAVQKIMASDTQS